jgi:hypothetical protein
MGMVNERNLGMIYGLLALWARGHRIHGSPAWADVANCARTDGTFWVLKEQLIIPRPA